MGVPSRYDLSTSEIASILDGEPRFRQKQLWHALYSELVAPNEVTTFPKALRERLALHPDLQPALRCTRESLADNDMTRKYLFTLHDKNAIESVLMYYTDRTTVCISSQAGCAMNCSFCATGQLGFTRHLTVGEIIEQVVRAQQQARADNRALSNIVFMGMGEPLANFDNVWAAIERLHDDMGFGARRITVSTVGVVPGIEKLARKNLAVNLAVSLHAANNTLRDTLVPLNKRYPLEKLMQSCRNYFDETGRRISFEWALIDGCNDTRQCAEELSTYAHELGSHVNVIPLNPTPGFVSRGPSPTHVRRFIRWLTEFGVNVTLRDTRGSNIDAACGQLALRSDTGKDT